jgi:Kef-type K+ transport system membrane component KefB
MLENIWFVAAIWMGLAFLASLISIRLGISVALIEILIGVLAGNFLGIHKTTEWINFLAMLGSGVLTFLAGAEIDPASLRQNLKISLTIGALSFTLPFIGAWMFAQYVLGWELHQAQIAGISLSTTSVAVVYAVMIERGLSQTALGKMILAACFITDFGTVLALGILFADFNIWLLVFVVIMCMYAVVHAAMDKVYHRQDGSHPRERAGGEIYPSRIVFSRGAGNNREERSRTSRISGRTRRCGSIFAR